MEDKSLKQLWLEAPDGQLDPSLKRVIEKWDDEPTAIQVLELLDKVKFGGGGSGQVVSMLEFMYNATLLKEGKTHEELVPLATWRTAE